MAIEERMEGSSLTINCKPITCYQLIMYSRGRYMPL